MNDQARKLRELAGAGMFEAIAVSDAETAAPAARPRCTSIAVTSGKGGVGKTNIALSLAIALSRMKKKVLLFDGDLGLANLHLLLGVAPRLDLSHVVRGVRTLEEVVWRGPMGVDILPGASGMAEMADLDRSSVESLSGRLCRFEHNYDYLIVDTAAGIAASVTRLASRTDLALLVLTPEPTSLADAYAMAKVLFEQGAQRIAAVVNMAVSDREGAETFDRLNALVVKFLKKCVMSYGVLPYEKEVPRSVKKQQVLVMDDPGGRFSGKIQSVAWKITGAAHAAPGGFFGRIWNHVCN
ncbi:MAG: P-loop NTPase [Chitinispirillaceae bacterium]|nr:P-loop NTPase [Chitinispirillaceae bacterium]